DTLHKRHAVLVDPRPARYSDRQPRAPARVLQALTRYSRRTCLPRQRHSKRAVSTLKARRERVTSARTSDAYSTAVTAHGAALARRLLLLALALLLALCLPLRLLS